MISLTSYTFPSVVRALLPLEDSRPGLISLLAGKPNADTFPITSLQLTLRDPISNEEVPIALTDAELTRSLQYCASKGIPDLLDWLIGLQEHSHGRKRGEGWDLTFGTGSSDLIYKESWARTSTFEWGYLCWGYHAGCERAAEPWRRRADRGSRLCVRPSSGLVAAGVNHI